MRIFDWLFGRRTDVRSKPIVTARTTPLRSAGTRPNSPHGPFIVWRKGSFPMEVVGESHYQAALEQVCGPHNREGYRVEVNAVLVREPDNPHDPNAVSVEVGGQKVGYLPRENAIRVGGQMDDEGLARVGCGGFISGGWRTNQYDEGLFGIRLAVPNQGWIDMGTGSSRPPAAANRRSAAIARPEPAKEGPLVGQSIVLWGLADTGPEAMELAGLGARIMAGVGRSTTMVVTFEDTLSVGALNSATYRKVQERIEAGSRIEIISLRALKEQLGLLD